MESDRSRTVLRNRVVLVLAFSLFFLTQTARAQYRFEVFNSEKGLPQNSVYSILQTRDGYLWLTTLDGLVRYDGAQFKVFSSADSKGIKSNRFTSLFEDSAGALWICTEDGGLTRYQNGAFTTYTTADGLPSNWTYTVRGGDSGELLVQTHQGLARFEDGRFTVPSRDMHSFDAVAGYQRGSGSSGAVASGAIASGAIWYRLDDKLRLVRGGETTTYTIPWYSFETRFYPQLYEDRRGRLWIGTGEPELLVLEDGKFTRFTPKNGLPAAVVTAFCEDADGAVWVGTDGAGLARFSDGKFTVLTTRDGLPGDRIMVIYRDREGTLWAGTSGAGVARLDRQIITHYSEREGLPNKSYYPILEGGDGSIWIGGDGLFRLKDGKVSYYSLAISPEAHKRRALSMIVAALYEDRDGKLWIGCDIDLFSFKDGKFAVETYGLGFDFSHTLVNAILRDSRGVMWFGTRDGLVGQRDGAARRYTTADGLPGDEIHALCEDRHGDLWIGTYSGLARLSNGGFTAYSEKEGLSGKLVRSIYEDGDGTLWIGTYDGGLNRFKDGRFTRYTTSEGLFSNGVFQILEDDAGNLWMSCNRGIFRVSRGQLNDFADGKITAVDSIAYGTADGMVSAECNGGRQPAGIRARDGRLWFPTVHGLAVVDPRLAPPNPRPPPVLIESAFVMGREVEPSEGGSARRGPSAGGGAAKEESNAEGGAPTKGLNAGGEAATEESNAERRAATEGRPYRVRLLPGQQGLEIRYSGLSFIKPDHVRFRYKMEGLDAGWTEAGNRRSAFYPQLPPGEYVFRVIAANSDGVWNEEGAALPVSVVPSFWQTRWFVVIAALTVLGLAALAYWYRVRQLTRAKTAQEEFSRRLISSQESERKRIAAELHDSLNQSLAIIKNRAVLSLNSPEDTEHAFEQLEEIAGAATRAIDEVREIAQNLRPFQLDRLGLTKSIESMARKAASANELRLTMDLDPIDGLLSKESEISLYRIIQESVNNMLKHARATEAEISLRREPPELLLTIRDNGIGFSPSQVDSSAPGFGLAGMGERVRILGGTMAIESAPGQGATITVRIPIAC